jgi:hypothetical protein
VLQPATRDVVVEDPVQRRHVALLDSREQPISYADDDFLTVAGVGIGWESSSLCRTTALGLYRTIA